MVNWFIVIILDDDGVVNLEIAIKSSFENYKAFGTILVFLS